MQADDSGPTDLELVQAAGSGDMEALGALYARFHRDVYALCHRMVRDRDVAEDLTHEAFLRVRRFGGGFDGRASVKTWLYRLVRNRCLDHLGARERERDRQRQIEVKTSTDEEPELDRGREAIVHQALARLKPDYREVLVLSRFGGMKYREIAETCGLTVSNVKVRAHRAMRALHAELQQLGYEHDA